MKTTQKDVKIVTKDGINEIWEKISEDVAASFRMDEEEKRLFKNKNIAKLIGTLPFIACCKDAERTAVSHLGTYVLSCREAKHYFNATVLDNESVLERLRLINNFKGGNKTIIDRGMSLLALIMITDYKRDIELDHAIGKYNPIGAKAFDFASLERDLLDTINSIDCIQMDEIYCSDEGGIGTTAYWSWS